MNLATWLYRWSHCLPPEALQQLSIVKYPQEHIVPVPGSKSEERIASEITLLASREYGGPLWRNNSGAGKFINEKRPHEPPRHVRFGLGNNSSRVNKDWKSADYIGIIPLVVRPEHVGSVHGIFTAIETKRQGWTYDHLDDHSRAQWNHLASVQSFGGYAGFAQSTDDFRRIVHDQTSV